MRRVINGTEKPIKEAHYFLNDEIKNFVINGKVYKKGSAYDFRGVGNFKTQLMPSSSVYSICFSLKTQQSSTAVLFENSSNWDFKNSWISLINYVISKSLTAGISSSSASSNQKRSNTDYTGDWTDVVIILNRTNIANTEIKIYKNKILQTLVNNTSFENSGDFISDYIFVGGRNTNFQLAYYGFLNNIRFYTHELSTSEIEAL